MNASRSSSLRSIRQDVVAKFAVKHIHIIFYFGFNLCHHCHHTRLKFLSDGSTLAVPAPAPVIDAVFVSANHCILPSTAGAISYGAYPLRSISVSMRATTPLTCGVA